jgi:phage terminase large subunit-like protein
VRASSSTVESALSPTSDACSQQWAASWPDRIGEWPTNSLKRMPKAVDRFRTGLQEGRVTHDGDEGLRRHVLNARLRKVGRDEDGRGRYTLEKAGPGRLIDGCVAAILAYEAATQIEEPVELVPFMAISDASGVRFIGA